VGVDGSRACDNQFKVSPAQEQTFFRIPSNFSPTFPPFSAFLAWLASHVLPQQPPKLSTAKNCAGVSSTLGAGWLRKWAGGRGSLQMSASSTKEFPVVKALPTISQLSQHIFLNFFSFFCTFSFAL